MPKKSTPEQSRRAKPGPRGKPLNNRLAIIYEDRDIIAIDKPAGLLTIATETEKSRTAYHMLTDYVRKGQARSRERVFIVHRLDRETSGILIFARSETAKFRLQAQWEETEKKYLAVVHGKMEKQADTISTYLAENKSRVVYSTSDRTLGKLSHTAYRVLKETRGATLLEVNLLTGRKNQIRVHLSGIGHPVVGDLKYGDPKDSSRKLALHACSIAFLHPHSGKPMTCVAPVPDYFHTLAGRFDARALSVLPQDREATNEL